MSQSEAGVSLLEESKSSDINLRKISVSELRWNTPEDAKNSMYQLYLYAEAGAIDSINWYERKKKSKARNSWILRACAIVLTTVGGLTPIVTSLGISAVTIGSEKTNVNLSQVGYLFLGLAGGCVAFDKFFGFSSGWMRYISTKMKLERSLSEFRMDWAMLMAKLANESPTTDQLQLMIQRLKEFLVMINNSVENETLAWTSEFKTSISDVEKTVSADLQASRPGGIAVTLTNGMETENGFTLTLDGVDLRTVKGTKYQIPYVSPGLHKLSVKGKIGNEVLEASELVNVSAAEVAAVTLALPVKEAQP